MADSLIAHSGATRRGRVTAGRLTRGDEFAIRTLDLTVAFCVLLFALPLLIAIAFAIKLQDGGPVIFAHERLGKGGRRFKCLKFRSMVVNAEQRLAALLQRDPRAQAEWARDHKLRIDPRTTSFGEFLRRSSLDELPQLINVLRGEMSIVGPRPIVVAEIARYGRRFRDYCMVKPGITGLWQVSGRNDVSYRRRVAMDTIYARHKSFAWDVQLLFLTVPAVLLASGSY
jgi:lipopolysaccharide/colanic/teichoic acid biosynthesis glycosyltransferase